MPFAPIPNPVWKKIGQLDPRTRLYLGEFPEDRSKPPVTPTIELPLFRSGSCAVSANPLYLLEPAGLGVALPTDSILWQVNPVARLLWDHAQNNTLARRRGKPLAFNLFSLNLNPGAAGYLSVFEGMTLEIDGRRIDRFAIRAVEFQLIGQ